MEELGGKASDKSISLSVGNARASGETSGSELGVRNSVIRGLWSSETLSSNFSDGWLLRTTDSTRSRSSSTGNDIASGKISGSTTVLQNLVTRGVCR